MQFILQAKAESNVVYLGQRNLGQELKDIANRRAGKNYGPFCIENASTRLAEDINNDEYIPPIINHVGCVFKIPEVHHGYLYSSNEHTRFTFSNLNQSDLPIEIQSKCTCN